MKGKKASKDAKDAEEKNEKARATLDEKLNRAHEEADKQTKALEKAMADAQAHHAKEDAALAELEILKNQQKASAADRRMSSISLSESQQAAENKIRELNGALAAAKIHEEEVVARDMAELQKKQNEMLSKQIEIDSKLSATEKAAAEKEKVMAEKLAAAKAAEAQAKADMVTLAKQVSLISLRFRGLILYTGGVFFHLELYMRQLWCSSIIICNITSIAYNHHTDIYPLLNHMNI